MLRAWMAILISLLVVGCGKPKADPPAQALTAPTPSSTPDFEATPGEKPVRLEKSVIKTKQGQRWELEADEVDWMDDRSLAKAKAVTWFLLGPEGERMIKVVSPGADVDMEAEIVTFTGEVVARRVDSEESLVVQHLVYNGKERLFHGSQGVLWKREGFELAGQTLTANSELDKVQLKGRVKGKTEGGLIKLDDLNASDQRDR